MKRNNKGFTLIELLVAVALMLSILATAIVSFVNIGNRKKEEAWVAVKEQIQTAAEQYFKSNEYLFEGLKGDSESVISVGKLVEEDYLNMVTNPVTGKPVSYCMTVKVTKSNGVFKTEVQDNDQADENKETCISNNSIIVKELGAPDIKFIENCNKPGNPGWCRGTFTLETTVNENNNGEIVSLKRCESSSSNCVPSENLNSKTNDKVEKNTDIKFNEFCYEAINIKGNKVKGCHSYKIDKTSPTFNIGAYVKNNGDILDSNSDVSKLQKFSLNNNWFSGWVFTKMENMKDDVSGIDSSKNYVKLERKKENYVSEKNQSVRNVNTEGDSIITYKACDIAGNCADPKSITVKLDRTPPTFEVAMYKKTSTASVKSSDGLERYSNNNNWYNKAVFTEVKDQQDTISGVKDTKFTTAGATKNVTDNKGTYRNINAEGISHITYEVCDNANNCAKSEQKTVRLDRTPPTIIITNPTYTGGDTSLLSNYLSTNGDITLNVTAMESGSGISNQGWYWKTSKNYALLKETVTRSGDNYTFSTTYSSEQDNNTWIKAVDIAGNFAEVSTGIRISKQGPSCETIKFDILSSLIYTSFNRLHNNFYKDASSDGVKFKISINDEYSYYNVFINHYSDNGSKLSKDANQKYIQKDSNVKSDKIFTYTEEGMISVIVQLFKNGKSVTCSVGGYSYDNRKPDVTVSSTPTYSMQIFEGSSVEVELDKFENIKNFGNCYTNSNILKFEPLHNTGKTYYLNGYNEYGSDSYYGSGIQGKLKDEFEYTGPNDNVRRYPMKFYDENYKEITENYFLEKGGYIYIKFGELCDNVGNCQKYNYNYLIHAKPE